MADPSPRLVLALQVVVYLLLALGVGSCVAVGADSPPDPRLVPAPSSTTVP